MGGTELELNSPQKTARLLYTQKMEVLQKLFGQLPEADQKLFTHGSFFLGLNGGLCGLIANSYFRRILNVTEARIVSSLAMGGLPIFPIVSVYHAAVTVPLISGDLLCETCAIVRGGLVGSVFGGLYPIFLAIPINGGLAARYSSTPLPGKENMVSFWLKVSKPVFKKLSSVVLMQAAFGVFLSSKQYDILMKMVQLSKPSSDPELLKD